MSGCEVLFGENVAESSVFDDVGDYYLLGVQWYTEDGDLNRGLH